MTDNEIPVDEIVDHPDPEEAELGREALAADRADEIMEAISTMEVELDDDPILRGPKHLNAKVAECRNYMNHAQRILEEVHRKKQHVRRRLNSLESQYDIKYDRMMVSDPDVQDCRAQKQRESMVRYKLSDVRVQIEALKLELSEIKSIEEVVSSKYTHLRETGWDISRQQKLIRDELSAGVHWGDESEKTVPDEGSSADPVEFDADEMDAAVAEEGSSGPNSDPVPDPVSDSDPDSDPVDDFDIEELLDGVPESFEEGPEEPPLKLGKSMDPDQLSESVSEMDLDMDVDEYLKSSERDEKRDFQVDRTEVRFDNVDLP